MYKYYRDEGVKHPLFIFTTDSGNVYTVSFRPYDFGSVICKKMFSMDFAPIDGGEKQFDAKISDTIIEITKQFLFSDREIVLKYLCDISDNRQRYRHIVFNSWFNRPDEELQEYEKYARRFENDEFDTFYLSFIYNKNVFTSRKVEEEVLLTIDLMEEHKN